MQVYLVGGAVRDHLLGHPYHEKDYVVVGATPEQLLAQGYQPVGKDFPVFLHPESKEEYAKMESAIFDLIKTSDGNDEIVIYVKDIKAIKRLGKNNSVRVENGLIEYLNDLINEENVKVVEKNIEKIR